MIRFVTGDIFKTKYNCIVNTVNCEGYMGKGIAYQFKVKYPLNYENYSNLCKIGEIRIGRVNHYVEDGITIINFPTKDKWRAKSKMEYITAGLDALIEEISNLNITEIAIPPLGCGNGGLSWVDVKEVMIKKLSLLPQFVKVDIYEPSKVISTTNEVKQPPVANISHIILMQFKPNLNKFTKFRIQKAAFMLNIFSGTDYFKFEKNHYGPYAHSIDILIKDIKEYQNYYKLGTGAAYDLMSTTVVSEKTLDKYTFYEPYIKKSADFINQFKSDEELELITTVLFIVKSNKSDSKEIIEQIKLWSDRKADLFTENQVDSALCFLEQNNFVHIDLTGKYEIVIH